MKVVQYSYSVTVRQGKKIVSWDGGFGKKQNKTNQRTSAITVNDSSRASQGLCIPEKKRPEKVVVCWWPAIFL
jgi:hypothetical protein